MQVATDRLEFVPPPTPGLLRAVGLAVLAHAFLVAALTWGVHWRRDAVSISVEAELWSALPQQAAPRLVEVAPEAPTEPLAAAQPLPAPPEAAEVDIALEQEKLRLKKEQVLALQKQQKLKEEKQLLEKKRQQELRDSERRAAEEKKKVEQEKRRKDALQAQEEARRTEEQRSKNLQRIAGLAGATGASTASGSNLQSSAPSSGYAGRVSARIKPNIVFTDSVAGNPVAEVDVRVAANGIILSRKLIKSSGLQAWDEAVLKAIDKTEKLPPDTDGRVPGALIIGFRPKD
ncbi:MAG: cell envelope integrity protein TolA [Rhodoferax sp.]